MITEMEKRKARVSLALTPSTKEKLYLLAELNAQTVNDFIAGLLDNYVQRNEGLFDKFAQAKKEFDEARRKLAEEAILK